MNLNVEVVLKWSVRIELGWSKSDWNSPLKRQAYQIFLIIW